MRASVCASSVFPVPVGPISRMLDFGQLHLAAALLVHLDALVVVVDRYGQLLLGGVLADHVLIQVFLQLQRLGKLVRRSVLLLVPVVLENRVAYGDALVANVGARVIGGGGDQLTDNVLALMAEGTTQRIVGAGTLQKNLR